jgi:hypothetical protein
MRQRIQLNQVNGRMKAGIYSSVLASWPLTPALHVTVKWEEKIRL